MAWVAKAQFDQEQTLRLIAEARLEDSKEEVARIAELLNLEREGRERDRLAHSADMRDLLDRYEPKPEKTSPLTRPEDLKKLSAKQILAIPATTRREMKYRQEAYESRLVEEKKEATEEKREPAAALEEHELSHIDTMLGIKQAAESRVN